MMSQLNIDKLVTAILTTVLAIGTTTNFTSAQQLVSGVPSQDRIALQQEDVSFSRSYTLVGKRAWEQGQFREAIVILNKAISSNPKNAAAQFWRGMCYDSLKEYDLAIADFDRTITLDSKYGLAYYMRGLNYGTKKKYSMAIADLEIAAKLLKESGDDAYVDQAKKVIEMYRILM